MIDYHEAVFYFKSERRSVCHSCQHNDKGESSDDHLAVRFIVNMKKPGCLQLIITYRKYHDIDTSEFKTDLLYSFVFKNRYSKT